MQTVALIALLMPTLTVAAAPVVQQEPPLQIWLSNNDHLEFDEEIRVYVRTESDGHLVVLHADPEGRVRVLFPLDPFTDDFIRGGRDFEIRDRENHDAIRTVEEVGYGTVYVAFSEDPFRYGEFSRGDHWDYRVFDEYEITGDAEGALTQIAQRMAVGSSFVYDTDTYYLSPPSAYARAYQNYRPSYSGRHDHHIGIRIGFNIGGPRYLGWPLHPYRYGYGYGYGYRFGASYWCDPFYYDPFCYDPFYFGFNYGYGFGYGGYYGSSYYYGRNVFYSPRYYTTSVVRVNRNYTTRNKGPVVASNYRDRRLGPAGVMASGASRRASPTRARPVRASSAVSRRTPTTRAATPVTTRRTANRGGTPVSQSGRRVAPQRSPTTSSNVRRATPTSRGTPTTVRGRTSAQPPPSARRSTATGERVREYRVAPRVSTRTAPTSRATGSTRIAPQQRATRPSSRSGTASRARPLTSSGSRATPMRSSGSRTSQARPSSSSSRRAAPQRSTSTRSRTSTRRAAPQRSRSTTRSAAPSRVQRSSPSRTTRSAPARSSSGRTSTRISGSSSRGSSSTRSSSGSRGSSTRVRSSGSRRRS